MLPLYLEANPDPIDWQGNLLDSVDLADLHGGLLALTEIAVAYHSTESGEQLEGRMREVRSDFTCLGG